MTNEEPIETNDDPTPTPPCGKYCSSTDIIALFGDISDDVTDDLFTTVLGNTEAWIESNLKRNYVPIPTTIPQALKTVAIYHGASDIILSLYHGEDLPIQYDVWFNKAQSLLDDYIWDYLNSDATEDEQSLAHVGGYSESLSYNSKHGRCNIWATSNRW